MEKFREKWDGKTVEDLGGYMSKEAKQFVSDFKRALKRELEPQGIEVISLNPNHYDCSGFLKKDDKYVYISYDIPRWDKEIDFTEGGTNGVLYRTAQHERDFTGGHNNFSSLVDLPRNIMQLYENYDRYTR